MNSLLNFQFLAQDPAAQGGTAPLMMMVVMFALMYFMIIRPQRRQKKEQEARIAALRSGDKIMTASGIYGLVTNVKDRTVIVKIAENVRVEMDNSSVLTFLSKAEEPEEASIKEADATVENV